MTFLPILAVMIPASFAVGGIIGDAGFLAATELLVFADVLAEGRIGEDDVNGRAKTPLMSTRPS